MSAKDTTPGRVTPGRQRLTIQRIERLTLPPGKAEVTLWDTEVPRLGVRLQQSDRRSYVYSQRINGQQVRLTIGPVESLTLDQARAEARRIAGLVAQGRDPRQDKRQHIEAAEAARREQERAKATFGYLWAAYIEDNAATWSERHRQDHDAAMTEPGQPRKRSKEKTKAGVLWPLREVRLAELTPDRIQAHMAKDAAKRPTTTARAFRLLRACLRWGRLQPKFAELYDHERLIAAAGKHVAKSSKVKSDVLQREQLKTWFKAVQSISEPAYRVYLQMLLLTGARSKELLELEWSDVDFEWSQLTIGDKVEGRRTIGLTPYVRLLLQSMPRRGKHVFMTARTPAGQHMSRANHQHTRALQAAGLPPVTLHGLRRSFGSLAEWVEVPAGIVAQIMGHKPKATAERHYRVRPTELLRKWHTKIEAWMLEQAGIEQPTDDAKRLEVVR